MLLYYHSWMLYNHFIATLYHFLGLTYWHSAQCQLLFFACFLLRRISVPNGVQMQRNFLENFYGLEDTTWAKEVPEGCPEGGTTHLGALGAQACPGGLCPPRWPPAPPRYSINCQIFQNPRGFSLDQKFRRCKAL